MLVDAGKFGGDGSNGGLDYYWNVSPDGRHLVFAAFENGSEELTLHVVEVESGRLLPDTIAHVDMTPRNWAPDGSGFFYNRLSPGDGAEKYNNTAVWFHRLGTDPASDTMVFKAGLPGVEARATDGPTVQVVSGSDYALAMFFQVGDVIESMYVAPLADALAGRAAWKRFAGKEHGLLSATQWRDRIYLVLTDRGGRGRLVRTSAAEPDMATAVEVVPEQPDFISGASVARDALYVETLHIGLNGLIRVTADDKWQKVEMPFDGADPVGLDTAANEDGAWLTYQSWMRSPVLLQVGADGRAKVWDTLGKSVADVSKFTFSIEMVKARDGVEVPLTLIRRKDAKRDGSIPIIITAYGAYGTILPTRFAPADMAWLERGGALAIAHVRGGGDLGEPWHQAAFKKTKPNSWRDLIDCARWLVAEKWTSPQKLIIQGKSAGGITVGRAMTEAPELFAAAILRVPAVNATRLHKSPSGPANFPEFGNPANADEFRDLLEMDAYLHVRRGGKYPAVLLTGGMNDGRIPVWIPAKMAARLQDDSCNPAILRVETKGGHGLGATRDQENDEKADIFAFSWWAAHRPARCAS
jgi:prolyl oligopeptidase